MILYKKELPFTLQKWTIPIPKNMTYIIAGKINDECFMMVDTIIDNNHTTTPKEKVYSSITNNNELYISLTGDELFMNLIQFYDNYEYLRNERLILDNNTLTNLAKELVTIISNKNKINNTNEVLSNNRIFYVNKTTNDVGFFDLIFNNNVFSNITHTQINYNEYVICNSVIENITNFTNSCDFCKDTIEKYYNNIQKISGSNPIPNYFQNGFSFYSNKTGYDSYHKSFSQYVNDILN